jgi:cytochrome c-type biogenesis protein CcmF
LKEFSKGKSDFKMVSKENFISIGSILLLVSLAVIFYGTSYPIISSIFSENPSSVEISYYNKMNLPIYVIVLFLTYITPYMKWKSGKVEGILKKSIAPIVISIAATLAVKIAYDGAFNKYTILIFASFLSFFANLSLIFTNVFTKDKLPALVSHMGLALLIVGSVISGYYEVKKVMLFSNNTTSTLKEKEFKYIGYKRIEKEKKDREKYKYILMIDENENKTAEPVFYWSQFNDYSQPFLEPGIFRTLLTDIYVSPNSVENQLFEQNLTLDVGEKARLPIDPTKSIELLNIDLDEFMNIGRFNEAIVSATVNLNGKIDTLYTIFDGKNQQFSPSWKEIEGFDFKLGFSSLVIDKEQRPKMQLSFLKERLIVEVSKKPMINLVWLGTILMVGGFIWAFFKRKKNS